jgi:hypothetical protein
MRRAWPEQVNQTQGLAVAAIRLGELDGLDPIAPEALEPTEERIERRVADLVGPARIKTYDAVGDGRRTLTAMVSWLRPRTGTV